MFDKIYLKNVMTPITELIVPRNAMSTVSKGRVIASLGPVRKAVRRGPTETFATLFVVAV